MPCIYNGNQTSNTISEHYSKPHSLIPKSRIIPKSTTNTVPQIASMITEKIKDYVPFPSSWKTYVETIPPGNTIKNHAKIWKKVIVGFNNLMLVSPYEKIYTI